MNVERKIEVSILEMKNSGRLSNERYEVKDFDLKEIDQRLANVVRKSFQDSRQVFLCGIAVYCSVKHLIHNCTNKKG